MSATPGIIEFNDAGLRCFIPGREAVETPGVAFLGDQLLFGQAALQQSRLYPTYANNQFWQRLSVEPLPAHHPLCRHHADLAYNHLINLYPKDGPQEVVFALPASFTRDQMSLLLGIAQQCPFQVVGLVDTAVAACASHSALTSKVVFVELQLHQTLLTELQRDNDQLIRHNVEPLANCGFVKIQDTWAQTIADQFVSQTRFDPLHSATSEQSLYNQLAAWVSQLEKESELMVEVEGKTAKITRDQLTQSTKPLFSNITQAAQKMGGTIILGDRFAQLLDAQRCLNSKEFSLPEHLAETVWRNSTTICRPDNVSFIRALPTQGESPTASTNNDSNSTPTNVTPTGNHQVTHVLIEDHAYAINDTLLIDVSNSHPQVSTNTDRGFLFTTNNQKVYVSPKGDVLLKVNNRQVLDSSEIALGDQLTCNAIPFKGIRVV